MILWGYVRGSIFHFHWDEPELESVNATFREKRGASSGRGPEQAAPPRFHNIEYSAAT